MLRGPAQTSRRLADDRAQLNPLGKLIIEPVLGVRNHMQRADPGTAYGFNRPAVHRHVIGVPGLAVCCEKSKSYLVLSGE